VVRGTACLSFVVAAAWYDCGVKTLLIHGGDIPLPGPVRDVIARGSTSLEERAASDAAAYSSIADADRVVFWSAGDDATRALAARCALAAPEGREAIVLVTPEGAGRFPGLADEQVFEWPRDEDRLVMAFMTGA
jgi:pimeloyl-ACP methyl ester carboxylesterase